MDNYESNKERRAYYLKLLQNDLKSKKRRVKYKKNNLKVLSVNQDVNKKYLYHFIRRNTFLNHFIQKQNIKVGFSTENVIIVPVKFSFKFNFNETVQFFNKLISVYLGYSKNKITIDFSKCELGCISCFTLLDIYIDSFQETVVKLNQNSAKKNNRYFTVYPSKKDKVSKFMHVFKLKKIDSGLVSKSDEYLLFGLQKGKNRSYNENKKSVVSKLIIDFINNSSSEKLNYSLSPIGVNAIDNLITEVLGNAEDHSLKGSEWYVNGVSFYENQHDKDIVELNLSILNIGESMYDAFLATSSKNIEITNKLSDLYRNHEKLFTRNHSFEKESLYTFYLLKEGMSRLKFESYSRGNGTMNFIDAFMVLGAFGEKESNFLSELNIISGHTIISIDNKYKPFIINDIKEISLNEKKDVTLLPDKKCLQFNQEYFPGTFIECKIFLNKDFFNEITTNETN